LNAHVPVDLAPGKYHVIACADDSNNVAEANENNNCARSATRIVISSGT
jgi:subtilase family serine protease